MVHVWGMLLLAVVTLLVVVVVVLVLAHRLSRAWAHAHLKSIHASHVHQALLAAHRSASAAKLGAIRVRLAPRGSQSLFSSSRAPCFVSAVGAEEVHELLLDPQGRYASTLEQSATRVYGDCVADVVFAQHAKGWRRASLLALGSMPPDATVSAVATAWQAVHSKNHHALAELSPCDLTFSVRALVVHSVWRILLGQELEFDASMLARIREESAKPTKQALPAMSSDFLELFSDVVVVCDFLHSASLDSLFSGEDQTNHKHRRRSSSSQRSQRRSSGEGCAAAAEQKALDAIERLRMSVRGAVELRSDRELENVGNASDGHPCVADSLIRRETSTLNKVASKSDLRSSSSSVIQSLQNHIKSASFAMSGRTRSQRQRMEAEDRVVRCIMALLFAAVEHTTSALLFALHELSTAGKLADELLSTDFRLLDDDLIDDNDEMNGATLQYTPLLDAVLEEVLRLHPPVPFLFRTMVAEDGAVLGKLPLQEGMVCAVNCYAMGRLLTRWEGPSTASNTQDSSSVAQFETFDPRRWMSPNNLQANYGRRTLAHVCFGTGARSCIGSNLSNVLLKTLVTLFVLRYRMEPVGRGLPPTEPRVHNDLIVNGKSVDSKSAVESRAYERVLHEHASLFSLRPAPGLHLTVIPRNSAG